MNLTVLAAIAALLVLAPACKDSTARFPSQSEIECEAKALHPLLGPAYDAVDTAKRIADGKASLTAVLAEAGADLSETRAAVKAFKACSEAADAGAGGDAGEPAP